MVFFFGFFFYILIVSWLVYKVPLINQGRNYRKDQFFIISTLGILLLLSCLRDISVGNDTSSYFDLFYYYGDLLYTSDVSSEGELWRDSRESGYRTLNYLVLRFTDNYQFFLSVVACFSYFVAIRFIRKYSSNVGLSCVLFFLMFYGAYTNLFRQVLAMSIVLLAFDWLNREKYLLFGIAVLFAAFLFHKTVLVSLLLIPMAMFRGRKLLFGIVGLFIVALVALGKIPAFASLLGITSSYMDKTSGISILFSAIVNIAFFLTFLYLRQGEKDMEQKEAITRLNPRVAGNLISWTPYVCLLISVVAFAVPVATRFELYFRFFYLILFPEMLRRSNVSESNKRFVINMLIFTLLVYIAGIISYRPEWVTEYNYRFFWETNNDFEL